MRKKLEKLEQLFPGQVPEKLGISARTYRRIKREDKCQAPISILIDELLKADRQNNESNKN